MIFFKVINSFLYSLIIKISFTIITRLKLQCLISLSLLEHDTRCPIQQKNSLCEEVLNILWNTSTQYKSIKIDIQWKF